MLRNTFFIITIHIIICMPINVYGYGNDANNEFLLKNEITNLKAADAALKHSEQELQELNRQDNIPESEITEFGQFVGDLKTQVMESCESLRLLGGDGNQHGVDCATLQADPNNQNNGNLSDMQRAPTRLEKSTRLSDELRKIESELDGLLLQEQEKLAAQEGLGEPVGGWGGEIGVQGQAGEQSQEGEEGQESQEGQQAQEGEGSMSAKQADGQTDGTAEGVGSGASSVAGSETESGSGSGSGTEKEITEIKQDDPADRSDDDVIARQLREAAEAETDEQLKKQLWEEYRKYKKSKR